MTDRRNAEIYRFYVDKQKSIPWISKRYALSRERVRQILRKRGIDTSRKAKSDRDLFLGVNISLPVKLALRIEAKRRGVSMSVLTSMLLRDMLVARGYHILEEGHDHEFP